jgi:multidrug efflux pump subunit AcrB
MNRSARSTGIAGLLAGTFLHSRLTPLAVFSSVLLGLLSLVTLPREEEPQIQVPMVDVTLAWPGQPVEQVERQLTAPIERMLWQIPGLEYLYSTSRDDGALLIARFKVGSSPDQALTRVRTRLEEIRSQLPPGSSVVTVAPRSIDDVPVLAVTLSAPDRPDLDPGALRRIGAELANELRKQPGVAKIDVLGGEPREVTIAPDPARLAAAGIPVARLFEALRDAGMSLPAGASLSAGRERELRTESPLRDLEEVRAIPVAEREGRSRRSARDS